MLSHVVILALAATAVCSQRIMDVVVPASGKASFQSPNFPNDYYNGHDIVYRIVGPVESVIQLEAIALDLETSRDILLFTELENTYPDGQEIRIGAFNVAGERLRSTSNAVKAAFKSDGYNTRTGFYITATALKA